METKCFRIVNGDQLEPVEVETALEEWGRGEGPFWFDVEDPDPAVKARLVKKFGLDEETIASLHESGHAARVLPVGDGVYFELPIDITGDPPELISVEFLVLGRALVTTRQREAELAEWTGLDDATRTVLEDPSAIGIGCALLLAASVSLRARSSRLRQGVHLVARGLDNSVEGVSLEEILALKKEIIDLDALCDERIAVIERLEVLKKVLFEHENLRDQFRIAIGNIEATARRADRLDRRANDLQSRYDSFQQERMNRRLSRLTIISAIFLPLTLMAGIYGMNFAVMPELQFPFSYPILLVLMAAVAIGMVWWFRAKGWME